MALFVINFYLYIIKRVRIFPSNEYEIILLLHYAKSMREITHTRWIHTRIYLRSKYA